MLYAPFPKPLAPQGAEINDVAVCAAALRRPIPHPTNEKSGTPRACSLQSHPRRAQISTAPRSRDCIIRVPLSTRPRGGEVASSEECDVIKARRGELLPRDRERRSRSAEKSVFSAPLPSYFHLGRSAIDGRSAVAQAKWQR